MAPLNHHGLSVVTFNVWGLWLISRKRKQRIQHLADWLRTCDADVVLLQEVWMDKDAQLLLAAGKEAGLQHGVHFWSGMFGSGLVTMARHPITQQAFWGYAAAGIPHAVHQGDYFAGKGVGWVRLQAPFGEVDVLNTHLHANYLHEVATPPKELRVDPLYDPTVAVPTDDEASYRIAQVMELAQLAAVVSGGALGATPPTNSPRPLILGGDLNSKPGSLEVLLLKLLAPRLQDAWSTAEHKDGGVEGNEEGLTCHVKGNTFMPWRQVPERIDYVLSDLACSSAAVVFTERTPSGCSYSDHFGVRAQLQQRPQAKAEAPAASTTSTVKSLFGGSKASPAAAPAAEPAAAEHNAATAAGLSEATARTVATASLTLLGEGINCSATDMALKSALGCFLIALVAWVAAALPVWVPEWVPSGPWFGVLLFMGCLAGAVGAASLISGRMGDKGQLRAFTNARRQLVLFMQRQGIQAAPGTQRAALAQAAGSSGAGARPKAE